jgi:O-antigen ligase
MVLSKRASRNGSKVALQTLPVRLGGWIALLLFVSFHLYAVGVLEVGELSIAIWHFIGITFSFIYFLCGRFTNSKIQVSKTALSFFFLCLAFSLWILICAFSSPAPERGFTMVAMQIINLCIVSVWVFNARIELATLNRRILKVAAGMGAVAIALYVPAILSYDQTAPDGSPWMPSVGYYMEHGSVPRLTGLARDPNFYSLWMSIPLMVGIVHGRRSIVLWLPVVFSVLMTLSRTFVVSLFFSSIALLLILLFNQTTRIYAARLLVVLPMLVMILFAYIFLIDTEQKIMYYRTSTLTDNLRIKFVNEILSEISESWNPIIGNGLRSAQVLLRGYYSHSTYLDILLETGLGGLFLWMTIFGLVGIVSLSQIRRIGVELIPWIYALLCIMIYFVSFSLLYHPFIWMVMALIVNQCNASQKQHHSECEKH